MKTRGELKYFHSLDKQNMLVPWKHSETTIPRLTRHVRVTDRYEHEQQTLDNIEGFSQMKQLFKRQYNDRYIKPR